MRRIICEPAVCYGAPCLEGTRIAVWFLRGTLAEIHDWYPDLALTLEELGMIETWCLMPTGQAYLATTAPGDLSGETEALLARLPDNLVARSIAAGMRALSARVQQLEEDAAGWIAATDPPALGEAVLALDENGDMWSAYHDQEWWYAYSDDRPTAEVRFWRPLPEPPTRRTLKQETP